MSKSNLAITTRQFLSYLLCVTLLFLPLSPLVARSNAAVKVKQSSPPRRSELHTVDASAAVANAAALFVESQEKRAPQKQATQPAVVNAPLITATKAWSFPVADPDGDNKAEPGQTINYTVNISNTGAGATDATGVVFSDTVDTNSTFVANSVHASPQARNESYNAVGNTLLEVGATPSGNPAVTVAGTLFDNDTISTDTIALASNTNPAHGTVTVNANGSFTYLPAVGYTGADSFTYTIKNSAAPTLTDTATVSITVASIVWYVNNSGSNGDGRSNSPFNSLTPVNGAGGAGDADAANDIIYLFTGSSNYTTGLVLENGQALIGNGVALVVNTFTLRAAGTRPTITNGGGNGITLNSGNTLSGFNLGNASGFAVQGTSVGALNVNNVAINTTSGGVDLTGVSTPTVNVVLDSLTSSGGTKNVNLVGLNGTVTLGSGALSAATTTAFDVSGAGNAVITYSGTIGNTAGRTISVANKNGGSVSFNGAVSGSGTGVSLTSNTGATINFSGGISLSTGASDAFTATGGGTINVTGTNTITTTTGTAVNINATTIGASNVTFQSINHNASNSGTNSGITLTSAGSGQFIVTGIGTTAGSGGTIQNIQGADAIKLNTTSGLVTLKNMIIQDITASNDSSATFDTRSNVDAIQGQTVNGGLTLNNVTIQRISDDGVNGSTDGLNPGDTVWNGLTITNCTFQNTNRFNVSNLGDAQVEAAVYIQGIKGTVSVTGSTFQNDAGGLFITTDTSGTLDMTVQSNQFLTLYKEVGTRSIGNFGISLVQEGSLTSTVRVGDPAEANATLGNTFTNGGDLASIRVIADTSATGDLKTVISRNTFTYTDHSSPGQAAGNQVYNFPQGGVLMRTVGSPSSSATAKYDGVFSHNTFSQAMHADGGLGQLSIIIEKGVTQFIVHDNSFGLPWDAPVELRADGQSTKQTSCAVLFQNNTYPDGTVGVAGDDLGGPSPYEGFFVAVRNGGKLDLTMKNETLPKNDTSSALGNSFYTQTTAHANTFNLFLQNIQSPNSFRLSQNAPTVFNLYRNGSVSGTVQGVLQDNGDRGGGGIDTTNPPTVVTTGTITLTNTAPVLPSITTPFSLKSLNDTNTASDQQPGEIPNNAPVEQTSTQANTISSRQFVSLPRQTQSTQASPTTVTATTNRTPPSATRTFAPRSVNANTLPVSIGTLTAGKTVTIVFQVTVNNNLPQSVTQLSNQGTVSGTNFSNVLTDDPAIAGAANPTITPINGPGTLQFSAATQSVAENIAGGLATITVTRAAGNFGSVSVTYATSDGTATAGSDYTATTNTLTWADGDTANKTFTVPILDDNIFEGNETINLTLSSPTNNSALGTQSTAVLTITDNDSAPTISINNVTVAEPDTGTGVAIFNVSLSNPTTQAVTLNYATQDGTATAPGDYVAITSTPLTFNPLATVQTVTVTVNADGVNEPAETFFLNLTGATNATLPAGTKGTATILPPVTSGSVVISEFRLRGAAGANDEFVELCNTTAAPVTVATSDGSAGWTLAASDGVARFTVPSGTVIPARGHYLGANNNASGGYSLGSYPAGVGTTATPNATYTLDIADDAGIALFKTALQVNFTQANALDAVGFSAASPPYAEGALLASPGANDGQYSFVRKPILASQVGQLTDAGDNATDFVFVATTGAAFGGVQSTLGAPGPENLNSPLVKSNAQLTPSLIAPANASSVSPNRVRDNRPAVQTPNSTSGTLSIQRRFTNPSGSGVTITRLRFRLIDITTLGSPGSGAGQADLRVLSSTGTVTDSAGNTVASVLGTTLETPPAQANGGGLNSTLTVTLPGGGLTPGSFVEVQMLLGINQTGNFRFFISQEALP